jgi:hypothetical protein
MKRLGFTTMRALFTLSSFRERETHFDWDRTVTFWSSIVTIGLIALYFIGRSS